MSEAEALEGLRRSQSKLRAYGERHGLVLREELPWPGYVPASQQPGPVKHAVWSLAGVLPGGAIGRLRHQAVFGATFGMDVAMQHTLMICRIPESVGYVPFLGCRPAGLGGGGGDGGGIRNLDLGPQRLRLHAHRRDHPGRRDRPLRRRGAADHRAAGDGSLTAATTVSSVSASSR